MIKSYADKNIFKEIIEDNWELFKARYPRYDVPQYNSAVHKSLKCGSEEGGFADYICVDCGESRRVCFSCKSCFCLSCSKVYVDNFVEQISKMLHPGVVYRHVILTIPEQLRYYFYQERTNGSFLSNLMKSGYGCLEDTVSIVRKKKLKIGSIIVVQTHGRSGSYNPHLHVLMTDGGIDEQRGSWVDLGYFSYEVLRKKWEYYLFKMVKDFFNTDEVNDLIDYLWKKYPKGLVANVQKGTVPESCRGLAKYLARYIASPPISVSRIVSYDGKQVKYWYNDHKSKGRKFAEVDVFTFLGRMVQHIMPKYFQRVRYYGLQSTRSFEKWKTVILNGLKKIGRLVKGAYEVVSRKAYRDRYREVSGKDPFKCSNCGKEMEFWRLYIPDFGFVAFSDISGVPRMCLD